MDTFIDKLAQKLTAQEMIKANAAADAAELQRARGQASQYEALLKEIKELNRLNTESARQVSRLAAEGADRLGQADQINRLVDESVRKIREMQQTGQNLEELEEKLSGVKDSMVLLIEELTDHVHKENVKVYRNVQAVVVEETAKTNEAVASGLKSLTGRLTAVCGISAAALLAAAAGLVFQVLNYLGAV